MSLLNVKKSTTGTSGSKTARVHPLSVGKVVNASEDDPKTRRVVAGSGRKRSRLKSLLMVDLAHWLETIRDRRFYRKIEIEFSVIDQYFRDLGFQHSRGMSLKPSRRILSKFQALSGHFHPVEKIHVVAPGDPIFHGARPADNAVSARNSAAWNTRASTSASTWNTAETGDNLDLDLGRIRQPKLIITSMRLLVFQGDYWVSHFYSDMVDELPSILSWSEARGWHRALDNDENAYYRRVRYISIDRKRRSIPCIDVNTTSLVSWLVQFAGERNAEFKAFQRTRYPFPWARSYLERDVRAQHLKTIGRLGDPSTKALAPAPALPATPPSAPPLPAQA